MKYIQRKACTICGSVVKSTKTITCSKRCSNLYKWKKVFGNYHEYLKNKILKYSIKCLISGCWNWRKATTSRGYGTFTYRSKKERANRVSYLVFKGFIPEGIFVCHTCDNPSCVNPDHLYLGTHQQNVDDKLKRNRQPRGEKINLAKLKEKDIIKIRSSYENKEKTQQSLADEYNVSQTAISRIIHKKTWGHLK
jgi:hypothetical protein